MAEATRMIFYHFIARKITSYFNDFLYLIPNIRVERFNVEEEEWEQVGPLNEAKCSLTAQVLNDRLYVFGGYIGEGRILPNLILLAKAKFLIRSNTSTRVHNNG